MNTVKKGTVSCSSVGADVKQPLVKKHNKIIPEIPQQSNLQATINHGKRMTRFP